MKKISLELSIKLTDYLKDIETEYQYGRCSDGLILVGKTPLVGGVKTLTLEEAIDFLPKEITNNKFTYNFKLVKDKIGYGVSYGGFGANFGPYGRFELLEAVEKMIEYLLDNNLLCK